MEYIYKIFVMINRETPLAKIAKDRCRCHWIQLFFLFFLSLCMSVYFALVSAQKVSLSYRNVAIGRSHDDM